MEANNRDDYELRLILLRLGWRDEHDVHTSLPVTQVTNKLKGIDLTLFEKHSREGRLSILNRQLRRQFGCEIVEQVDQHFKLELVSCSMEWQQQEKSWSLQSQPNGLYSLRLNVSDLNAATVLSLAKKLHLNIALPNQQLEYAFVSRGERLIAKILTDMNLSYEVQKCFPDLRDVNPLRFDFYIAELQLLVEFDGEQHFRAVQAFGGQLTFENTVKHDQQKNIFCTSSNVLSLLRIGYWQINNASVIVSNAVNLIRANRQRIVHDRKQYLQEEHEYRCRHTS